MTLCYGYLMHATTFSITVPNPFGAIKARRAARAQRAARIIEINQHVEELFERIDAEFAKGALADRSRTEIWYDAIRDLAIERCGLERAIALGR